MPRDGQCEAGMAGSQRQASGFTHRVRELVGVQVVVSVDDGLTFAMSGQELGIVSERIPALPVRF